MKYRPMLSVVVLTLTALTLAGSKLSDPLQFLSQTLPGSDSYSLERGETEGEAL
jgi:hypothetical protein